VNISQLKPRSEKFYDDDDYDNNNNMYEFSSYNAWEYLPINTGFSRW
jgi:hypothetical protein